MPLRDMIANANSGGTLYAIPSGVIMMWSGSIATIPSGFVLCNGANGTPDLRDRFIVAAGSSYNPGDTGGVSSVALTSAQSGMPSHAHNQAANGFYFCINSGGSYLRWPYTSDGSGPQTTLAAPAQDAASAHENRPPYYALAYIMKT